MRRFGKREIESVALFNGARRGYNGGTCSFYAVRKRAVWPPRGAVFVRRLYRKQAFVLLWRFGVLLPVPRRLWCIWLRLRAALFFFLFAVRTLCWPFGFVRGTRGLRFTFFHRYASVGDFVFLCAALLVVTVLGIQNRFACGTDCCRAALVSVCSELGVTFCKNGGG